MTALTDIQKALNTIRRIIQKEAVRLEALALMAGVIEDKAKDVKNREPKPQRSAAQRVKPLPIPQFKQPQPQQTPLQTTQTSEPEVSDSSPQKNHSASIMALEFTQFKYHNESK